jgi:hypothetical protein
MTNTTNNEATVVSGGFRPSLAIYHPNGKGTGCAMKMELHPAHDDIDGSIMMSLANQKSIGGMTGGAARFATFDWENRITVKLDFSDICRMLQVFRGECESIEDGKGLFHNSPRYSTKIMLRHMLEPRHAYSLEVYRNSADRSAPDTHAHILLTTAEAYGIAMSFESSIGVICFGIPKVIPHDVSDYRNKTRAMRNVTAAVA